MNGVNLAEFSHDLALPLNKMLALDEGVMDQLMQLAGLDAEAGAELVSWTGRPLAGVRMMYRGDTLVSRAIRSPVVRGCPQCLHEASLHRDPLGFMAMSGAWLLRHTLVCLHHERALAPLWTERRPRHRYDIQARLAELADEISQRSIQQAELEPTPYDRWLDTSLASGEDDSSLGGHPINVAATMCYLVGLRLGQGGDAVAEDARSIHDAYSAGFALLSDGKNAFEDFLDDLLASRQLSDRRSTVLGPLYAGLRTGLNTDDGFDFFRDIVREKVLRTWPVAAGEMVLGRVVERRRLHSLASAAEETGEDEGTLRRLLVAQGVIPGDSDQSDATIVFPAEKLDRMTPMISELVHLAQVREAMGASETQFDALVDEGLIRPRIEAANIRRAWAVQDGLAIVSRLAAAARPLKADVAGWLHPQDAAARYRAPLSDLFRLIERGQLVAGLAEGANGYGALRVLAAAVEERFRPPQHAGLSPSAFGTSIGVRGAGAIQSMIDEGLMTASDVVDPRTGRVHIRILPTDADSFHRRFYSLQTAGEATGLNWRRLASIFTAQGVEAVSTSSGAVERVYARASVDRAVARFRANETKKQ